MNRDSLETISTLAHLSKFVIVDISDARSVLQELQRIVPSLPSVPVQPIILESEQLSGMLDHFNNYRNFLKLFKYKNIQHLISSLDKEILSSIEEKIVKKW